VISGIDEEMVRGFCGFLHLYHDDISQDLTNCYPQNSYLYTFQK